MKAKVYPVIIAGKVAWKIRLSTIPGFPFFADSKLSFEDPGDAERFAAAWRKAKVVVTVTKHP